MRKCRGGYYPPGHISKYLRKRYWRGDVGIAPYVLLSVRPPPRQCKEEHLLEGRVCKKNWYKSRLPLPSIRFSSLHSLFPHSPPPPAFDCSSQDPSGLLGFGVRNGRADTWVRPYVFCWWRPGAHFAPHILSRHRLPEKPQTNSCFFSRFVV